MNASKTSIQHNAWTIYLDHKNSNRLRQKVDSTRLTFKTATKVDGTPDDRIATLDIHRFNRTGDQDFDQPVRLSKDDLLLLARHLQEVAATLR